MLEGGRMVPVDNQWGAEAMENGWVDGVHPFPDLVGYAIWAGVREGGAFAEASEKKFHLMYYIYISLYLLVIPPPLIPPIPPVVTSCSKCP